MTFFFKGVTPLVTVIALAGCAAPIDRLAEKPYCHADRGRKAYCTKDVAPSLTRDEEAKQFAADPAVLTVFLVRYWGDGHHAMDISVDGGAAMETVPSSMIRLRMKAGSHRVSFSVGGKSFDRMISGTAGEVRFMGITGTDWSWGSSYHAWVDDSDDQIKRQARRSRLIRDISLL